MRLWDLQQLECHDNTGTFNCSIENVNDGSCPQQKFKGGNEVNPFNRGYSSSTWRECLFIKFAIICWKLIDNKYKKQINLIGQSNERLYNDIEDINDYIYIRGTTEGRALFRTESKNFKTIPLLTSSDSDGR